MMVRRKAWLVKLLGLLVGIFIILIVLAVGIFVFRPREKALKGPAFPTPMPPGKSDFADIELKERAPTAYAEGEHAMGRRLMPPISPTAIKVALARKLIREAWLTLLVRDVPEVVQQVRQVAEEFGGYVATLSQTRKPDGSWSATLILRIPTENYHKALSRLQQLGQVDELREQVQDVTEEFVDLEARLRNLKRSEQHLLELLKRTGKVGELLQVEKELSLRRQEIERLEGRLRYLSHQVGFSTICVTLNEFRPRPVPGMAFSVPKVFADAFRAVVFILRGALVGGIWILVFGIIWLPLSVIAWLWVRKMRRTEKGAIASGSE